MPAEPLPTPPVAPRRPHRLTAHGQVRIDDWYWLADRSDPEVLSYLQGAAIDKRGGVRAATDNSLQLHGGEFYPWHDNLRCVKTARWSRREGMCVLQVTATVKEDWQG